MELKPDAIMVSPFEETGYGQLEKLGIPLLECADYMETSPLARAEWMRFYGRLFGVGSNADTLFQQVKANYMQLCETAARTPLLYSGEYYSNGYNGPEYLMPSYYELGCTLWKSFVIKEIPITLKAECINLTDYRYELVTNYPMPGRQLRLTATIDL